MLQVLGRRHTIVFQCLNTSKAKLTETHYSSIIKSLISGGWSVFCLGLPPNPQLPTTVSSSRGILGCYYRQVFSLFGQRIKYQTIKVIKLKVFGVKLDHFRLRETRASASCVSLMRQDIWYHLKVKTGIYSTYQFLSDASPGSHEWNTLFTGR